MTTDRLPPPQPAPDPLVDACAVLLGEAFASASRAAPASASLRERLLARVERSAQASRAFFTVRERDGCRHAPAPGVTARTLYECAGAPTRSGEPRRVRMVELAAGAVWRPDPGAGSTTEWLVMAGALELDRLVLARADFHRRPDGEPVAAVRSAGGARLYLRESPSRAGTGDVPVLVRDAGAAWHDFAPGIRRRVLWQHDGESALLYHASPGAQVPRHAHRRDEECLMLDGELFLDDLLLRSGDYQLAPAGTVHDSVVTDTGVLLFAHGDLDLDVQAD